MKTKFVTALYSDISGPPFYGHFNGARRERYLHSLRTLNNMDNEIICYCNETEYDMIKNQCDKYELNNVRLKISNLIDYPNAERMIKIKEETNEFKFYHEVDWNKLYLMRREYDPSYDYLYWIDVGLSHRGLFTFKYNKYEAKDMTGMSRDWVNYAFTGAFNPQFVTSLNNWVGDKLLNLGKTQFDRSPVESNRVFEENRPYSSMTVGGIIGGHISKIDWLLNEFNKNADFLLDKKYILNHEQIMGKMAMEFPENYRSFEFNTWYHDDYWMSTPQFDRNSIVNSVHFVHFWDNELNMG